MRVKVARLEGLCRQLFGKHAEQTAVPSCVVEDDEIRGLALKWSQQGGIVEARLCLVPQVRRHTVAVFQCQVLRCQERATRNFVIDQGESGLYETIVCEVHAAALKSGERYVYNSAENVIYMGQDAPPQNQG